MTIPATCPCCGAYSITRADETSRLLLVCDVLVVKALERVGNRIVRSHRPRFHALDSRGLPLHEAHTLWPAHDDTTAKALDGAWDVLPVLLPAHDALVVGVDPCDLACVLDGYVHDLVITGTAHETSELALRVETRLGLELPIVGGTR